jgi:cell division cycle protein 37
MTQGGMLSLEEQIIDATTEEGQAQLKKFEEQERAERAAAAAASAEAGPTPDPE